jgi:hypothetical protein
MTWGFRVEIPTDAELQGDLVGLDPTIDFGTNESFAPCVSDLDANQHWTIAGGDTCIIPTLCSGTYPTCEAYINSVGWTNSLAGELDDFGNDLGSFARGMSATAKIAGWALDYDGPNSACIRRASYWSSLSASVEDLADFMPQAQLENPSRAEAVNDLALPWVVGTDTEATAGMLWESNGDGTWTATNLNTSDAISHSDRWEIRQAHAVNDGYWIAAFARDKNDGFLTKYHVVVLVPFMDCPGDLNDDDHVNSADLLIVINHWGACPSPPDPCPGDINSDGLVNTADMLIVINGWGLCAQRVGINDNNAQSGESSPLEILLQMLQSIPNVPQEIIDAVEEALGQ